jgi:hypothetical protein
VVGFKQKVSHFLKIATCILEEQGKDSTCKEAFIGVSLTMEAERGDSVFATRC